MNKQSLELTEPDEREWILCHRPKARFRGDDVVQGLANLRRERVALFDFRSEDSLESGVGPLESARALRLAS